MTGGSRGLGLQGYRVLTNAPHRGSVRLDLASPQATHRIIAETLNSVDLQQVDDLLVVSNAATLEPLGPTHRKTAESIVANLNTNFVSPVIFLSDVVGCFRTIACRKVLANVSAGAARRSLFGWSLYCAAKVAMENFIQSLAIEQQGEAHPFIPVNVDPGPIDTGIHLIASAASSADFPAGSRFTARREAGQLNPPAEIAKAIVRILLSPSLMPAGHYDARDVKVSRTGTVED